MKRALIAACYLLCAIVTISCQGGASSSQGSTIPLTTAANSSLAGGTVVNISANSPPSTSSTSETKVPVNLTYRLPTANAVTSPAPGTELVTKRVATRRPQYISASNTLLTIVVTPLGGNGTTFGPSACTTSSCAISFNANPGTNTLAFTLTDNSSNVLSTFTTLQVVQPGGLNTLNFTANPTAASVTLQLATASANAGTPLDDLITILVKDADGNTIVGSPTYLDANGNQFLLHLDVSNNQAGGNGSVVLKGPTTISTPWKRQHPFDPRGGSRT
jgi:hypothetical protein